MMEAMLNAEQHQQKLRLVFYTTIVSL